MLASECSNSSPISTSIKILRPIGVVLVLVTLSSYLFSANPPSPYEARLTQHTGDIIVRSQDNLVKGPPLRNVTPLNEGDWVFVGRKGFADVSFTNGTLVRLNENTALRLRRIAEKDTLMILAYGTLLSKVQFEKGAGIKFTVLSPNAMATVHGTEFVFEDLGSRAWIGVLDEGHVLAKTRGFKKQVMMHFNQETLVHRGLPPQNAQVLEHLYHYKIEMANIRSRLRGVRKQWKEISVEQRKRLRAAWERSNRSPVPRHAHPHGKAKQSLVDN
jgi:hypothetical protein